MKILYISVHNECETAVANALVAMGHEVIKLHENNRFIGRRRLVRSDNGKVLPGVVINRQWPAADFMLFHHWANLAALRTINIPKVFWYFDLVEWKKHNPPLQAIIASRASRMREVTAIADLGFLTDGDWVNKDTTGKLHWLTQPAFCEEVGVGTPLDRPVPPILFTGSGRYRGSFVDDMRGRWGGLFNHVGGEGRPKVYGYRLRDLIASSKIVVAPDIPVTDNYWSDRVFVALGYGAFLLHPYCRRLTQFYEDGKEIVYYRSREELHSLIGYYLSADSQREAIASAGLARTIGENTYRHRCEVIVQTVRDRLGI